MGRLIYAIPSWILFFGCVFLPLLLLGWVIVPIAAACKAYEKTDDNLDKPADGPIYHFTWPMMLVWDNFEDGIANQNYKKFKSQFMRIVYWSCLRNPVNNLRIVSLLSFKLDKNRVRYIGSLDDIMLYDTKIPQWYFAWHGFYSCFYWQFNLYGLRRLWIGWKIYPTDLFGVTKYREPGVGFAIQFKRVK